MDPQSGERFKHHSGLVGHKDQQVPGLTLQPLDDRLQTPRDEELGERRTVLPVLLQSQISQPLCAIGGTNRFQRLDLAAAVATASLDIDPSDMASPPHGSLLHLETAPLPHIRNFAQL